MKNVSSYEKRKIIEYLKSRGYTNRDNTKFILYLDGRACGFMGAVNFRCVCR